jgi:CDP-diacylglycerol--glycerol-3-phosphate 3-phosphatidyltransferase
VATGTDVLGMRMPGRLAQDLRALPNVITLLRIALLLIAAAVYFAGHPGVGIVLAVIAGVTDYVDGAVARATGQVTRLGEILDQFSDLCYESMVLIVAVAQGFFPPWVLLLYLVREFWVVCIRRFMAGARLNIPSSIFGKLKTNLVMWGFLPTFLSIAGLVPGWEPWLGHFGRAAVGAGLLMSYLSAFGYTRAFIRGYDVALSENEKSRSTDVD